jgi:hypothetical protein
LPVQLGKYSGSWTIANSNIQYRHSILNLEDSNFSYFSQDTEIQPDKDFWSLEGNLKPLEKQEFHIILQKCQWSTNQWPNPPQLRLGISLLHITLTICQ